MINIKLMKKTVERNKKIAISVLNGKTFISVGKQYGLTKARIPQITNRLCRMVNLKVHSKMTGNSRIKWLRENKEFFINNIRSLTKESYVELWNNDVVFCRLWWEAERLSA